MEFLEWLETTYGYTGGQDGLLVEYTVNELHWLMNLYEKRR